MGPMIWFWWYQSMLKDNQCSFKQEWKYLERRSASQKVSNQSRLHNCFPPFLHFYGITLFQRICLFIRALFFSLRIWVYSTSFLKKGTQDEFWGLIRTTLPWPQTSFSPLHTFASSLPSSFNSSTPSVTSFLLASTSWLCLQHWSVLDPSIAEGQMRPYVFKVTVLKIFHRVGLLARAKSSAFSCQWKMLLIHFSRQLPHLSFCFSWLTFSSTLAFNFADTTYQ